MGGEDSEGYANALWGRISGKLSTCFISGVTQAQSRSVASPTSAALLLLAPLMLTPGLSWSLRSLPCLSHCGIRLCRGGGS